MSDIQTFKALCLDGAGNPKAKDDCRATLIDHLILDDSLDIDEAEDKADEILNALGLWQEEKNEGSSIKDRE